MRSGWPGKKSKRGRRCEERDELARPRARGADIYRWEERSAHVGTGADLGAQPAFGSQLLERLNDQAPGDSEIRGERPRGRQPAPGGQPATSDRFTQAGFDLVAKRRRAVAAPDAQEDFGGLIGHANMRRIGPFQVTTFRLGWSHMKRFNQPSERVLRGFFLSLAALHLGIGIWMFAAPHSFFLTIGCLR